MLLRLSFVLPLALLLLIGCGDAEPEAEGPPTTPGQPETIAYDEEQCTHTGDTITNKRYGAILITTEDERLPFASVEDMVLYELSDAIDDASIAERWVVDAVRTSRLLPAKEARFLQTQNQPSPGGYDITPFIDDDDLSYNTRFLLGGEDMYWDDVVAYVCAHDRTAELLADESIAHSCDYDDTAAVRSHETVNSAV